MTATTKTYTALLASTSLAAGSTKAAPGQTSSTANLTSGVGGAGNNARATITCSLTNGSSAPGSPAQLVVQISGDGATWRDYAIVAGDVVASSAYTWAFPLPREAMYARGIAYGNTTNAVTVSFEIQVETDN